MSSPETTPTPTITRPPPAGRKFPCGQCGARLDFDPASRALKCPYCGHNQVIQPSAEGIAEQDWEAYWTRQASDEVQLAGRASQVTCTGCNAVVLLQDNIATDRCPYCGTHLENQPQAAQAMISPGGILPFTVSHRDAINAFDRWIAGRWFAPSGLRQFANLGKLQGVYVPFWTFDSMTYTWYQGERGDDYTDTETYWTTETDASGNTRQVQKTRTVTRTRWSSVSGEVDHFFDDVLIHASHSMPDGLLAALERWDLEHLEDFKADFLSGFQAERYTVGLKEGFERAREVMDAVIRSLCCRDIGGDHQRLHSVQTQHVGVTFKHILLPVWLAAYRYHNRPYQILINGRTGQVAGTRPYSVWKIVLLVLFIIAVIAMMFATCAGLGAIGSMHGQRPTDSLAELAERSEACQDAVVEWSEGSEAARQSSAVRWVERSGAARQSSSIGWVEASAALPNHEWCADVKGGLRYPQSHLKANVNCEARAA